MRPSGAPGHARPHDRRPSATAAHVVNPTTARGAVGGRRTHSPRCSGEHVTHVMHVTHVTHVTARASGPVLGGARGGPWRPVPVLSHSSQ